MKIIPVDVGTIIECIAEHEDGIFYVGELYKINAHQVVGKYAGVRIRDAKRERKDFNFIPTSKNYFWKHFKVVQ